MTIETVINVLAQKICDEKKIPFAQDGLVETPNKGNRHKNHSHLINFGVGDFDICGFIIE